MDCKGTTFFQTCKRFEKKSEFREGLGGLDVDGDECVRSEMLPERLLDVVGTGVGLDEGDVAVHADVEFHGVVVADAAGAEVVQVADVGEGIDDLLDVLLHVLGQGGLRQLAEALPEELPGHPDDEEGDHQRGQRVEHGPAVPQQDGAADAHQRAERGEGVAAMVPGVGLQRGGIELAPLAGGVLVGQLLQENGDQGGPEGQRPGSGQVRAVQPGP